LYDNDESKIRAPRAKPGRGPALGGWDL
jgi:hypothetical protein